MHSDDLPDLLTLAQLRLVASTAAQPYRIQAQVDAVQEKTTSSGSSYYELRLQDGTEPLTWRVFDSNTVFREVAQTPRGTWLELTAMWVDKGKYGMEPTQVKMRLLQEREIATLLSGAPEIKAQQERDYDFILQVVAELQDPRLKALAQLFLTKHSERFRRTAAAREYHHARRGGLVEHVAQMLRAAQAIAAVYPALNADLLLTGVLFHDCGKLWETCCSEQSFSIPHQLSGEMLGHIPLGLELVNKLWREMLEAHNSEGWVHLQPANDLVRLHLLHLIGSHHGEYAFGSPVLPKTPEAIALHYIDNLDAKMEMFRRGYETGAELASGIYERMRPLPANLIEPLPHFQSSLTTAADGSLQ
jgi:3'-5' exoribonuclease